MKINSIEKNAKLKAAWSVTFDHLILENNVSISQEHSKKLKFRYTFTNFVNLNKLSVSKQQH